MKNQQNIIDENKIQQAITTNASNTTPKRVRDILQKALTLKGLDLNEAATLLYTNDEKLLNEIFNTAKQVKEEIYGKRLVLFAPLYISNYCNNNCLYCAFRSANKSLHRCCLSKNEIIHETELLVKQGHKRMLLVSGEAYPNNDFHYIIDSINTIYQVKCGNGSIRRINVNIAPLETNEFKELKQCGIGTYQLFQETYHRQTYKEVHVSGKKANYDWRLTAIDRAIEAGIDDVGIGALFGLADWRFDTLALIQHAEYLQNTFGVGPHTISVPRLEPALGSVLASNPRHLVSDNDFCKIVAVLRLAVPYTGIIMSTRETPKLRNMTLALGVSQISAGSRTNPGGYSNDDSATDTSQFCLGDHRSLDEVIQDIVQQGYFPSFCTACYRLGRTGTNFMCLAQPGDIKHMCIINSLITFYEYLLDYATPTTKAIGEKFIHKSLAELPEQKRNALALILKKLQEGKRDLYI